MASYAALSDAQKETCGLCFDAGGTSYSLDDVAKAAQHLFQGLVEPLRPHHVLFPPPGAYSRPFAAPEPGGDGGAGRLAGEVGGGFVKGCYAAALQRCQVYPVDAG